jgi:hypothetical protein
MFGRYLMKLDDSEEGKLDFVRHACQNDLSVFSLAFQWLKKFGENVLKDRGFCASILRQKIGEYWEVIAEYLELFGEEVDEVILTLLGEMRVEVVFLNDVFEDVREGGIVAEDLSGLFGGLKVLGKIRRGIGIIENDLRVLKRNCERREVLERVNIAEMKELCNLLRFLG